jgi:hypothetical protein
MQAAWPDADGGSRLWHGADGRRWREREIAAQRCHYVYLLEEPVTRPRDGRKVSPRAMKPMWYYNQVAAGLTAALSGDRGFRGYVSKNPLRCDLWHVVAYRSEPYKLADLAAHVDIGVDGAANWIDKTPVPGRTVAEKAAALHDWLEEHYPSDDGVFFVLRTAAYKAMDDIVAETSSRPVAELELASQLADAAEELRHRTGCHHAWVEMVAQRVADYVCRNHSRDRAGFTALRGINRGAMGLTGSPDLSLTNRQKMAGRYTARKRAQSAQTKVRRAEERLRKRGERPTAAGVAREAGVARQTAGKHMTTERRPGRPVAA